MQQETAQGSPQAQAGTASRNPRPLVMPEPYTGEGDYTQWQDHFESVAAVNGWNDADKLLWLRVRLTGRAQTAFKRLPEAKKATYRATAAALSDRFEPASKRELHIVEFQTRRKVRGEGWADFGDDLRVLADRAYPDLQEDARERLSLNRYLDQLTDPQIAFGVRQTSPGSVDEAVTATLRMESYRVKPPVTPAHPTDEAAIATVVGTPRTAKYDPTAELLQTLLEKVERLEASQRDTTPRPASQPHRDRRGRERRGQRGAFNTTVPRDRPPREGSSSGGGGRGPVICHRCGKEGHYARGCAVKKPQGSGNW